MTARLDGALEAIDRILNRGGDADDVLRAVVRVLHERAGFAWAAIAFAEEGRLVVGPHVGELTGEPSTYPVTFHGEHVAELRVAGGDEAARPFLERVALLVSPYCLVGWDTGGVPWDQLG